MERSSNGSISFPATARQHDSVMIGQNMKKLNLAVIAGDGVGHEVIPAAKEVLEAAGRKFGISYQFTDFDWGTSFYQKTGSMMPADGLDQLRQHEAILLGAVGHPDVPDHVTLNGLLLPIRRGF